MFASISMNTRQSFVNVSNDITTWKNEVEESYNRLETSGIEYIVALKKVKTAGIEHRIYCRFLNLDSIECIRLEKEYMDTRFEVGKKFSAMSSRHATLATIVAHTEAVRVADLANVKWQDAQSLVKADTDKVVDSVIAMKKADEEVVKALDLNKIAHNWVHNTEQYLETLKANFITCGDAYKNCIGASD